MTAPCGPPTAAAGAHDALLEGLRSEGARRDEAVRALHALLLRAARFELSRRAAAVSQVRGEGADDLALQAADDAFVAVMAKLGEFRGESRFSTWAYKFAIYEAAVRVRVRSWQQREVVVDTERWLEVVDAHAADPARRLDEAELLRAIRAAITSLTERQRTVLVAVTLQGVPIDVLAQRTGSTRGALYKTLHDARRRLRAELAAGGYGPLP